MNLGLTQDQVEERRLGIGGSDAARVMSGDWISLFKEKTGRAQPEDLSGILAVQMGHVTEPFNAFWYTRTTGREVTHRGDRLKSDTYPFMVANLDGLSTTRRGHRAYWDAKHVGRPDEQTVLRYTPQMVHCCTILDLDWWVLSVFIGNTKHEIVEQEVDPLYQATLIAKEREFWGYVERDEEPPDMQAKVLAPKPQPKLRTILLDNLPEVERPNWAGEFTRLARVIANTEGPAKAYTICRKDMTALVPEDVGLVRLGLVEYKRDGRGVTIALKEPKDGVDDRP